LLCANTKLQETKSLWLFARLLLLPKGRGGGIRRRWMVFFILDMFAFFYLFFVNRILKGFFLSGCFWSQTFLAIHLSALKSRNLFICSFSNFITSFANIGSRFVLII